MGEDEDDDLIKRLSEGLREAYHLIITKRWADTRYRGSLYEKWKKEVNKPINEAGRYILYKGKEHEENKSERYKKFEELFNNVTKAFNKHVLPPKKKGRGEG